MKKAVRGMLPKNRLRDKRLARLKGKEVEAVSHTAVLTETPNTVFEGVAHPYKDNLVKFGGRVHLVKHQVPDITKSIEAVQATAASG